MDVKYRYAWFIKIGLILIGIAGIIFAVGDAMIPQEGTMLDPMKDPAAFADLVTSDGFKFWAARGLVGVPLELIGSIALWLALLNTPGEKLGFWGMLLTVLPDLFGTAFFSFFAFLFPDIGEMYLSGNESVVQLATLKGFMPIFMVSMLLTFLGLFLFGIAVWRSKILPKWSGFVALVGFLMIMISNYYVQILANLIWGLAYLWMAIAIWGKLSPEKEVSN